MKWRTVVSETMKVKLNYFGMLTESAGCTEEKIEVADGISTRRLQNLLTRRYPSFAGIPVVLFAENKKLPEDTLLKDGQEIDCLPPFSGG